MTSHTRSRTDAVDIFVLEPGDRERTEIIGFDVTKDKILIDAPYN